ncbi:MAG: hypothetical protein ACRDJ5_02125, partial [Actinomycetota bacterium]
RRVEGIHKKLKRAYGAAAGRAHVIGGDLNRLGVRAGDGFGQIDPTSWWRMLTGRYSYNDSVYQVKREKGVDYVFSTGGIRGAGWDRDYNRKRDRFYSDHAFRWAELGYDDTPPEAPSQLDSSSRNVRVRVEWNNSGDDAGIFEYDVYRAPAGSDSFRKIGSTPINTYYDEAVRRWRTYRYKVRAKDWSRNRSAASVLISQTARG